MKKIIPLVFICFSFIAKGQEIPLYTHSYNNLYLYNPAYAGSQGYGVFYLTHRRQWEGFDGAPVTSSLTFDTPLKKSPIALGGTIFTDKRGILSTTGFLATFGYKLEFSETHFVNFGLSAGMVMNTINLDMEANPSDPAILNRMKNSNSPDAQFGMKYQMKDFQLGISLPRLFKTNVVNDQSDKLEFNKLNSVFLTTGYKIHSEFDDYVFEPLIIYRYSAVEPSQIEVNGVFTYKNSMWAGASYRQGYGASAIAGLKFNKKISIAYSFDRGTSQFSGVASNTHEFQVGYHLGVKKHKKKPTIAKQHNVPVTQTEAKPVAKRPTERPTNTQTQTKQPEKTNTKAPVVAKTPQKQPVTTNTQVAKRDTIPVVTQRPTELNPLVNKPKKQMIIPPNEKIIRAGKGNHEFELDHGSYVIVGAFASHQNAMKYRKNIQERGYEAYEGFNTEKILFYVYLFKVEDIHIAIERKNDIRHIEGFENAWIFHIE